MSAMPLLFFTKAHVKAHDRRLPSGKVIRVRAHDDGRVKRGTVPATDSGVTTEALTDAQFRPHYRPLRARTTHQR